MLNDFWANPGEENCTDLQLSALSFQQLLVLCYITVTLWRWNFSYSIISDIYPIRPLNKHDLGCSVKGV